MKPPETDANVAAGTARLREALREAASALKEKGPRFALAGSYALWAYGAPEPSHDVDLAVTEEDAAAAAATLRDAGFAVEHPPEDWLFKARVDDTVVDILHRLNGVPVGPATLDCAELRDVLAIAMPVLPPTMVLVQKLRALGEHHCDFAKLLPAVRAIRERLDWDEIRAQTADNDYAVAFLVLAERLGLTD
ncbi:nucleotidyltransferase [Mycobacterium sp. 663a-19]|uniref:nucleotidyltransferase n=1 Tax=Mycobacterium sp. 663a-19 TaxID=2986148 RepID=UPI002D1E5FF1|nr:nucleotidyltransferase [Mycobacterium sp. 663a-19]MEB3982126.1 nucleotidyltransferase [Mycobacterium sp. 663a-19]